MKCLACLVLFIFSDLVDLVIFLLTGAQHSSNMEEFLASPKHPQRKSSSSKRKNENADIYTNKCIPIQRKIFKEVLKWSLSLKFNSKKTVYWCGQLRNLVQPRASKNNGRLDGVFYLELWLFSELSLCVTSGLAVSALLWSVTPRDTFGKQWAYWNHKLCRIAVISSGM